MHLTSISGRHIKGGDFDVSLSRANVIHGENFAGKTRIADAVRLLLVGHLPELGNTNPATFGLASGPFLEVFGTFSDGSTIRRRWTARGDSVKQEVELPPQWKELQGSLAVMLNAEEYFALSDRERVAYVFKNCPSEDVLGREAIADRALKVAPGLKLGRFMSSDYPLEARGVAGWLDDLIAKVAEDWKAAKEQSKRFEETARGLTHLRALDAQARPLAALEDERAKLERAHADLFERRSRLDAAHGEQRRAVTRRGEIAREIVSTDKDAHEKVTQSDKLDLILREQAAAPAAPDVRALLEVKSSAQRAYDGCKVELGRLQHDAHEIEKEIAGIDGKDSCPFCGASGTGWKTLRLADLSQRLDALKEKHAAQVGETAAASVRLETALREYDAGDRAARLRVQLTQEEARVRSILADLDRRLARRTALEQERDRLPDLDPLLAAEVEELQGQINVNREDARRLDVEVRDGVGRAHDLKRLAESEKARDEAVALVDQFAAAGKELRAVQAELVEAAFRPLLERANLIVGGVLASPLAYRDGQIGTWRSGQWVGHRTFSGVEKALTYVAIQAALTALSPVRVMLLDELGRMTARTAALVARAVLGAIDAGLIDQFVGIDPDRRTPYAETKVYGSGAKDTLAFQVIEI